MSFMHECIHPLYSSYFVRHWRFSFERDYFLYVCILQGGQNVREIRTQTIRLTAIMISSTRDAMRMYNRKVNLIQGWGWISQDLPREMVRKNRIDRKGLDVKYETVILGKGISMCKDSLVNMLC